MNTSKIQKRLRDFAKKRDWTKFHSPKNLAMALAGETGELLEIFQWLTEKESFIRKGKTHEKIRHEIADILVYILRLADILKIDLDRAVEEKMKLNHKKYPVHLARGTAKKYTEL